MNNFETEDSIYSTVPGEHMDNVESERKQLLLDLLRNHPGTFHTTKNIAKECGFPTRGTQVEVRKAITEFIELDKFPIVGNCKGFTWATNSNMLKYYLESLGHRSQGLQRRMNAVKEIFEHKVRKENSNTLQNYTEI